MCYNPRRVLAYEYFIDGVPKNLILWSTTNFEFMIGFVRVSKNDGNLHRISQKMWHQIHRDGITFPIIFKKRIEIPCEKCMDCCKRRAREWSVRCQLESLNSPNNYFITLTYNEKSVPKNFWFDFSGDDSVQRSVLTCDRSDISKFMKALRQFFKRNFDEDGIRFFACTEYGTKTNRPHIHMILFNCNLRDLYYYGKSKSGFPMFRSPMFESVWKKGMCFVQPYTPECGRYVAQYCLKKLNKRDSFFEHKEEESLIMSRNPGIGSLWFLNNVDRLFTPIVNGNEVSFCTKVYLTENNNGLPKTVEYSLPSAFERKLKRVTDCKRGVVNELADCSAVCVYIGDVPWLLDSLYYSVFRDWKQQVSQYQRDVFLESVGSNSVLYLNDKEFERVNAVKRNLSESRFKVKRDFDVDNYFKEV